MQDYSVEKAAEDIALIKKIVERTSGSLVSFSKVFIRWGILFLCQYFIYEILVFLPTLFPTSGQLFYSANVLLPYIVNIIGYLIVLSIYFMSVKNTMVIGLGRQLMYIWLFIFTFVYISPLLYRLFIAIFSISYPSNVLFLLDYTSSTVFDLTYAFGFLSLAILTKFKLPGYFAVLYFISALFFLMPNPLIYQVFNNSSQDLLLKIKIGQNIFGLVRPLTFIILGFFLRNQKADLD